MGLQARPLNHENTLGMVFLDFTNHEAYKQSARPDFDNHGRAWRPILRFFV